MQDFIILKLVIPNLQLSEYKFDSISFWIQLHNIPPNLMSIPIIHNRMDGFGVMDPIDPFVALLWGRFARVRVTVSTDFKIKDSASTSLLNGSVIIAQLKYERLHLFCTICCSTGHEYVSCSS